MTAQIPQVDQQVRILWEWLAEACPTVGQMLLVQARTLEAFLEIIPMEERPPVVQALWQALADAIDELERPYDDLDITTPCSTRH